MESNQKVHENAQHFVSDFTKRNKKIWLTMKQLKSSFFTCQIL